MIVTLKRKPSNISQIPFNISLTSRSMITSTQPRYWREQCLSNCEPKIDFVTPLEALHSFKALITIIYSWAN